MMITIVRADDWIAIYHGDSCIFQDHSIEPDRLLQLLNIECKEVWAQGHADEHGYFPELLKDVQRDGMD